VIEKFERSFALAAACWKVLLLDKEMLLFPIMSTLALIAVFGGGGLFVYSSPELLGHFQALFQETPPDRNPVFWALMFALSFIGYFIMIFFNAGLLTCALIRFAGGDPTVMDGLSSSVRKLPQIFLWALVTATVGWILNMLESRLKGLGRFFIGLLGTGWAVATYFVVPILVVDGVGPVTAIRRSVAAVRKTWGEALVTHVGIGLLNLVPAVIALPLIFFGTRMYFDDPMTGSALIATGVVLLLLGALVITTLSAILRAGLYIYAVEGEMPLHFDSRLVRSAFD